MIKQTVAVLMVLCIAVLAGCSNKMINENPAPADESINEQSKVTYEHMIVGLDIEGIYLDMMSDVTAEYHNGHLSYVSIENPAILAYCASDKWDGGMAMVDGNQIAKTIETLEMMCKYAENDEQMAQLMKLIDYYNSVFVYTYCPT